MDQDDIFADIYSCKCCLDIYNRPVLLECGHSVCTLCADRLLAFHTLCIAKSECPDDIDTDTEVPETWMENDVMLCPECGQATALLEHGAESLPLNANLQTEVEKYSSAKQMNPICGFGCGKSATLECLVCKCALCSECSIELHSKPAFKSHEIGPLGELDRRTKPLCITHNKDLSMYCTSCKGMVCVICVTVGESHKGHNCISIEEYLDTCKEELTQGMDLLRARHAQLMIAFLAIEKILTDLNTAHNNFEEGVENVFGAIIQELLQRKHDILSAADESRIVANERLSKQANCLLSISKHIDTMSQNVQRTTTTQTQPCFDTKQLCLNPCTATPDYLKFNLDLILDDIIKLGKTVLNKPMGQNDDTVPHDPEDPSSPSQIDIPQIKITE